MSEHQTDERSGESTGIDEKKVSINLVVTNPQFNKLQTNALGNRNALRSRAKKQTTHGIDVTVPESADPAESEPHTMTVEDLLEYVVHQLIHNRNI